MIDKRLNLLVYFVICNAIAYLFASAIFDNQILSNILCALCIIISGYIVYINYHKAVEDNDAPKKRYLKKLIIYTYSGLILPVIIVAMFSKYIL
ncbi:hypothetical protein [Flammeovirga sp. SubArs3]|uniref:hypothetical protein n=1 Tax=Flammeovirga sp. SubArs3 TaxID=2995316 RepID=UPI00248B6F0B|nr:hypothetical protein [Flammeovirga sp. SubArs3]